MSDANSTCIVLPVLTVQNSFSEVIKEVQVGFTPYDRFWVSCYKASEPSVHTKIRAELDDRDRNLVLLKSEEDGVDIKRESSGVSHRIESEPLNIHLDLIFITSRAIRSRADRSVYHPQRSLRLCRNIQTRTAQIRHRYVTAALSLLGFTHLVATKNYCV